MALNEDLLLNFEIFSKYRYKHLFTNLVKCIRLRGATVARLTPDQKVACSNHVGVRKFLYDKYTFIFFYIYNKNNIKEICETPFYKGTKSGLRSESC